MSMEELHITKLAGGQAKKKADRMKTIIASGLVLPGKEDLQGQNGRENPKQETLKGNSNDLKKACHCEHKSRLL